MSTEGTVARAPDRRLGVVGIAFLLLLPCALAIGIIETTLADTQNRPDPSDLLYGANLHLLLAVPTLLLTRLLLWRQSARCFPLAALGAFLLVELAIVVSYWLITAPWAPRFTSWEGRVLAVGVVVAGAAIGLGLSFVLVRGLRGERWARAARRWPAAVGLGLVLALLVANGALAYRAWPRGETIHERPDAGERPRADVIIILLDTLRQDHLSFFGYPRATSPHIDRLLSESYVFAQAYTPSNKTIPSIASLFTGLYPTSCGVRGPFEAIPTEAPTLAEHFRSYGYRTAAFIANLIVTPQGGFAQGFETYFPRSAPWWTHRRRTALEQIAQRARKLPDTKHAWRINRAFFDWLEDRDTVGEPLFAYLHYMEPHSPYAPGHEDLAAVAPAAPPGPTVPPLFHDYSDSEVCIDWECLATPVTVAEQPLAGMVARYDGEIHACDRHLGRLFERLGERGLLDRAHLLFLTDHGEQFGEHGGWYHGHAIYDELVRSPMAYRPPGGLAPGVVIERPVAMLDLLRTLLELLELEIPPLHQGRAIPELLARRASSEAAADVPASPAAGLTTAPGEVEPVYPRRFAQTVLSELPPHLYALRLGPWKLVQRGDPDDPDLRLYHLGRDPRELRDLSVAEADTLQLLRSYLLATLAGLERQRLDLLETRLDPETLQQLRDLGYIR